MRIVVVLFHIFSVIFTLYSKFHVAITTKQFKIGHILYLYEIFFIKKTYKINSYNYVHNS